MTDRKPKDMGARELYSVALMMIEQHPGKRHGHYRDSLSFPSVIRYPWAGKATRYFFDDGEARAYYAYLTAVAARLNRFLKLRYYADSDGEPNFIAEHFYRVPCEFPASRSCEYAGS